LVSVFNPCANTPETGDFMGVMNQNLNDLERVIKIQ
jgi:hypothetical protein